MDYSLFSEKCREVVRQSHAYANQCGYASIEPQLLMVSLIQVDKDFVYFLLDKMSVDRTAFCQALGDSLQTIARRTAQQPPLISTAAEKVLKKAADLAQADGMSMVLSEYLFLAAYMTEGVVRSIMNRNAITEQKIRNAVAIYRNGDATSAPANNASTQQLEALNKYASCYNILAQEGKIEPAIGRDAEMQRTMQILSRKTKNNPILVGVPGTGKTAIIEGLAHRIINGDVPPQIQGLRIYSLDFSLLIAGAGMQGEFESRLKKVIEEAKSDPNIVLFIDEIHLLIGAGQSGAMDAANILKPALARGEIKVIGATTNDEYSKYIEKDKAFARRFQKITVGEPDIESAIQIMRGIKTRFERFHGIAIEDEALVAAVNLSARYISDRFLPDKAIDLLDEAAACEKLHRTDCVITEDDIRNVITDWTGIPVEKIDESESHKLLHLEDILKQSVVGQDEAVTVVANAIRRNRMGFSDSHKPIASFLFLGTTGVGKTELAKALADYLFNSRDMMVRIDMSEYQLEHSVARLFGAPPGYVGYEQGGQLTEAVRRKPYSVILLDEIEKAHRKVFDTLLQVLDDGRMTDGQGNVVDFKNTIIIMTSNMTAEDLTRIMSPEFINRINDIVHFHPLSYEIIVQITQLQLERLARKLTGNELTVEFDASVAPFIAQIGYIPEYGARPIQRAIENNIVDALASKLLTNTIVKTSPIKVSVVNGQLSFRNITPNNQRGNN